MELLRHCATVTGAKAADYDQGLNRALLFRRSTLSVDGTEIIRGSMNPPQRLQLKPDCGEGLFNLVFSANVQKRVLHIGVVVVTRTIPELPAYRVVHAAYRSHDEDLGAFGLCRAARHAARQTNVPECAIPVESKGSASGVYTVGKQHDDSSYISLSRGVDRVDIAIPYVRPLVHEHSLRPQNAERGVCQRSFEFQSIDMALDCGRVRTERAHGARFAKVLGAG